MKRFGRTALAAAAVALFSAAAALAGPTTVTNTYTVGSLTVPGVSTGIVLEAGGSITVSASGTVCFAISSLCYGPNGNPAANTTSSAYGGFVLPGAPAWGLIGRVGAGPWIQVGSGTTLSGTGQVVFAVNDDLLGDNRGSFTVTVSYQCWPGWGYGDENHHHCGPPGLAGKSTPADAPAAAAQETSRPGHGYGDENHDHSGPRGRS
jgi:hypothetical protein